MSIYPDIEGKVVVLTGGSTGIGRAVARALAVNGAKVVIGDYSEAALETLELIKAEGGQASFFKTNVADEAQVQALVGHTLKQHGRVDLAFNNAGVLPPTADLADMSSEDFDRTIAVDLRGVFLCLKYEIRAMLESGGGAIVNTTSVAGLVADPGMAPYVAAKHGVVGLTRAAALDYARRGIRVNALAPGLVRSPMTDRWLADPAFRDKLLQNSPIGRPAEPHEMAGMVLYLLSDSASFTTGQVFTVDGAQTAH